MGEIRTMLELENEEDKTLCEAGKLPKKKVRKTRIEAVVDTGAVMMLLPQDVVENLGLRHRGKAIVSLANDQKIELEIAGNVALTVAQRRWSTDCLVGPPGCEPLLGQLILERLDLIVDPVKRTVTPRPESPFLPTLKLKQAAAS